MESKINELPEEFKSITSFGMFYEMICINYGMYCLDNDDTFVNFDKNMMEIIYNAWIEYGLIQRPEIAYNVSIQALRDYHQNLTKESEKITE